MNLTPSERLWLWRRRKGWTQAEAAERFEIARRTYILSEQGKREIPKIYLSDIRPTVPELLALARRRSNLGTREIARLAGVSHVAILKAERDGKDWLRKFWIRRGSSLSSSL